jgi:drug/metabolite transporter (DMT)-like permease
VTPAGERARAFVLLLCGMSVVGSYVAFSKVIVAVVPIYLLALLRFAIAAVLMLPLTFPAGSVAMIRRNAGTLFFQSFFGNFLFSIFMLSGIARTSATAAGLVMSTLPAVVALMSTIALRERVTWRTGAAIALAVIGVASLTLSHNDDSGRATSALGNLLVFGAVLCEAAYVVIGKRLTSAQVTPMQISSWMNIIGLVLVLPFGLWQATSFNFDAVPASIWALVVLYAICASWISTWLWLSGLRVIPASQAGVFTVALPIAAALIGVVFLSEKITAGQLFAFFCAALGIVLVTLGSKTVAVRPLSVSPEAIRKSYVILSPAIPEVGARSGLTAIKISDSEGLPMAFAMKSMASRYLAETGMNKRPYQLIAIGEIAEDPSLQMPAEVIYLPDEKILEIVLRDRRGFPYHNHRVLLPAGGFS